MTKTFTKADMGKIRIVLNSALQRAGDELDLDLTLGNMSYDSYHFTAQVKGMVPGVLQPAQQMYDLQTKLHDLPPRGSQIRFNGGEVRTVWGWNSKAPKFPILLAGPDGEVNIKCTVAHLGRSEVINAPA